MKVTTDPNQFKMIMVAVQPMAEIFGMVADETGKGIGRIIVRVTDKSGNLVAKVLTESDGYFNYIGFKPGDYKVFVDSLQLDILKFQATPVFSTVLENPDGDVVDAGTIVLVKKRIAQTRKVRKALPGGGYEEVEVPVEEVQPEVIAATKQEAIEEDTLALFTILFDVDRTIVKNIYMDPLQKLAKYLNKPIHEELGIDIQGHTDSDASEKYNLFLSNRRAEAVKQVLVKEGVRSDRLKTSAFGKSQLVNTSRKYSDKALNRRVIFKSILATDKAERPYEEVIVTDEKPIQNVVVKAPVIPVSQNTTNKKTQVSPTPANQKVSATVTHQILVPYSKPQNIRIDGSVPERCTDVPSWCLMYHSRNNYWFQAGAFDDLPGAMKMAQKLKKVFDGNINIVMQDNWVKVQIGYYDSQAAALKDAEILYSKGFIK